MGKGRCSCIKPREVNFERVQSVSAAPLSLPTGAQTAAGADMSSLDIFYHPLWALSTAVLAVVVRLQRRLRWTPEACDVRLTGKTAIVTGANTGNRPGHMASAAGGFALTLTCSGGKERFKFAHLLKFVLLFKGAGAGQTG